MRALKKSPWVLLKPNNLVTNVWGGAWIPRLKNLPVPARPVGESWEFSLHPDHPSRVQIPKGQTLARVIKERRPFLLKILDARDHLSVQVHPDDRSARRVHGTDGKTESWIILETAKGPNNGFIYLGFKPRRGALRRDFEEALESKNEKIILSFLNKVRVKPGEVYHVPARTIHAIGGGVRLAEIQQSSNVTYRIWDWNRPVVRPLHVKEAFDVLSFVPHPSSFYRKHPRTMARQTFVREEKLINDRRAGYAMNRIVWTRREATRAVDISRRFVVLTVVKGEVQILVDGGPSARLVAGRTAIVLRGVSRIRLTSLTKSATVLKSFIP